MGNSDCGIGFIHVLSAGTAGPKRVNAQIPLFKSTSSTSSSSGMMAAVQADV